MKGWINGIGWVARQGCGRGREAEGSPTWDATLRIPTRKDLFAQADLRFGRLDSFSRVGLAGITMCLRDAGLERWQHKRPIGTLAVTDNGCLQTDLDYLQTMIVEGGKLASPNLFAYTLPNCFLGEAALRFGLTGSSLILHQQGGEPLAVVQYALEELNWNTTCEGLLAGFCNVPVAGMEPPAAGYGSLFVLLVPVPDAESGSYGKLESVAGKLRFNGVDVADFRSLVNACLITKKGL